MNSSNGLLFSSSLALNTHNGAFSYFLQHIGAFFEPDGGERSQRRR
jgi:hypothetical protein